jgi:DNA modification methylase
MTHLSENCRRLKLRTERVGNLQELNSFNCATPSVFLLQLPFGRSSDDAKLSESGFKVIAQFFSRVDKDSTVCVLTTPPDAATLIVHLTNNLKFRHWIVVKTSADAYPIVKGKLPSRHAALLILTKYNTSLKHTQTRIQYTYCPSCGKTTKDYGGKRHMYHEYGTSISDVWRDIEWDPRKGVDIIANRLRDLFGLEPYRELILLDLNKCTSLLPRKAAKRDSYSSVNINGNYRHLRSRLIHNDCLESLRTIPSNSIDFCFADLPYNLKKKYYRCKDELKTIEYFEWCDRWLAELYRVLKPGRTLAVLNIPKGAARHYDYLSSLMEFQSWIVWESLSFPVRKIMPAHYSIVCFSKGAPRQLPGLGEKRVSRNEKAYISPKGELFCIRPTCVSHRIEKAILDRAAISDIWFDVYRLTHNSRRVSHPCQLPPLLMRRLYALFTKRGEIILDCFNGAGTSTLIAQQMGRGFIGIEISKRYHNLAIKRHKRLNDGKDPFEKVNQIPNAKNSPVQRLPKQRYKVSKKTLQLEVKQIAEEIGRLPRREDVLGRTKYPIKYFDDFFASWGEVCAAARAVGFVKDQHETDTLKYE